MTPNQNIETADDLEKKIEQMKQQAAIQRQAEEKARKNRLEVERGQDMETLKNLKSEIKKLDSAAAMSSKLSLNDALALSEKKAKYQADIDEIEEKYGIGRFGDVADQPKSEPRTSMGISTSRAIYVLIGLFVGCCALTSWVGMNAINDPYNPVGQSMMKNAPLRALVAFDMTFLTFLVGVFFVWLFFNDLFQLWHNRINSERNLSTLLSEAPSWAVLFFLLGVFALVMWVFANYYLTAYA
ncbi:hypothetical protein GVN20_24610 [Runella sp. CRIBMP]|uniref:hypothetical protein n=1 Tax=Runella sp. CRIBMP TaxID=2683261 RepID=UPI001411D0EE|nr:hypothetical protein [Runella sp. CRIBMP]NBB22559.1 hypothetical protein [Runella sp. CRIBMP]